VHDLTPNVASDVKKMWCGRVLQLLSFQFRSETTDQPVTCNCAYLHLLYDYFPKADEQRAVLDRGIQMLYESEPPVVYLIPVEFILGKLPVVRVGDTGRIPSNMHDHNLMRRKNCNGRADEIGDNGKVRTKGSALYYVNKYAMEWSTELPESEEEVY
jgi:hypothetical protein